VVLKRYNIVSLFFGRVAHYDFMRGYSWLLLGFFVSCGDDAVTSTVRPTGDPPGTNLGGGAGAANNLPGAGGLASGGSGLAGAPHAPRPSRTSDVQLTVLTPTPINLRVADLPKPYASQSLQRFSEVVARPANATLAVPEGFVIHTFADSLPNVRNMAIAPNGDVFVAQSKSDRITVLRDADHDGVSEFREVFAESINDSLAQPFGLAFHDGFLYVANSYGITRFVYQDGQTRRAAAGEHIGPEFSTNGHWTRNLLFNEQNLFVAIGSVTNIAIEPAPRATIQRFDLDGTQPRTFASGLRNPVGLAVHPGSHQLWTAVNERDGFGDDLVPDYLTSVKDGGFYGWPYAYLDSQHLDPTIPATSQNPDLVATTQTPEVLFEAHSAPLGLAFYDGSAADAPEAFPLLYKGDAFVALHGSWNRSQGTGYKVVRVAFDETGQPKGGYEDFATGWLIDPVIPQTWGRPVGVTFAADGTLLVADDGNGVVWRITYNGSN